MREAESISAKPPLSASWMVLDTVPEEFQLSQIALENFYLKKGLPSPVVRI
jgi:hypothetical protein